MASLNPKQKLRGKTLLPGQKTLMEFLPPPARSHSLQLTQPGHKITKSFKISTATQISQSREPGKQQQITSSLTTTTATPPAQLTFTTPSTPTKPARTSRTLPPTGTSLLATFLSINNLHQHSLMAPKQSVETHQNTVLTSSHKQTKIKQFFSKKHRNLVPPHVDHTPPRTTSKVPRHCLLTFNAPRLAMAIRTFTIPFPTYDLIESWGHSLPVINPSQVFRVFLQSPNGLSLKYKNFPLQNDFYISRDYGAAILSLPETNVNWNLPYQ